MASRHRELGLCGMAHRPRKCGPGVPKVGTGVRVLVAVAVAVSVGVDVLVGVAVFVGVDVAVDVADGVTVAVFIGVDVESLRITGKKTVCSAVWAIAMSSSPRLPVETAVLLVG